jgi:hypothetical protein
MAGLCRSFLHVDGVQVVNNDGLHGDREICGGIKLAAGDHVVVVSTVIYAHSGFPTKARTCTHSHVKNISVITGNYFVVMTGMRLTYFLIATCASNFQEISRLLFVAFNILAPSMCAHQHLSMQLDMY